MSIAIFGWIRIRATRAERKVPRHSIADRRELWQQRFAQLELCAQGR